MKTINNTSTAELMDIGISCLIEKLVTIETERFISALLRERSDYIRWRRYFADVSSEEFHEAAVAYGKANPL